MEVFKTHSDVHTVYSNIMKSFVWGCVQYSEQVMVRLKVWDLLEE